MHTKKKSEGVCEFDTSKSELGELSCLPDDILCLEIFSFTPIVDLDSTLLYVSRKMNELCRSQKTHKMIIARLFGKNVFQQIRFSSPYTNLLRSEDYKQILRRLISDSRRVPSSPAPPPIPRPGAPGGPPGAAPLFTAAPTNAPTTTAPLPTFGNFGATPTATPNIPQPVGRNSRRGQNFVFPPKPTDSKKSDFKLEDLSERVVSLKKESFEYFIGQNISIKRNWDPERNRGGGWGQQNDNNLVRTFTNNGDRKTGEGCLRNPKSGHIESGIFHNGNLVYGRKYRVSSSLENDPYGRGYPNNGGWGRPNPNRDRAMHQFSDRHGSVLLHESGFFDSEGFLTEGQRYNSRGRMQAIGFFLRGRIVSGKEIVYLRESRPRPSRYGPYGSPPPSPFTSPGRSQFSVRTYVSRILVGAFRNGVLISGKHIFERNNPVPDFVFFDKFTFDGTTFKRVKFPKPKRKWERGFAGPYDIQVGNKWEMESEDGKGPDDFYPVCTVTSREVGYFEGRFHCDGGVYTGCLFLRDGNKYIETRKVEEDETENATIDGYFTMEFGVNGFARMYYPEHPNKLFYEGSFMNGSFYGFGIMYNRYGKKKYEGYWRRGYRDGQGKEFRECGNLLFDGLFQAGMPVSGKIFR